jgi:predicted regulator of Ras-like GTPase activity (Roadblock/LC7/MglB family)
MLRTVNGITEKLFDLVQRTGSITALLISKDGVSDAEAGDTSILDTAALAALIAAMFSATREVALMVGEEQFSILLQQGEHRHIHISLVTETKMMVVIFEDYQRIGRIRHEARKTGEQLAMFINTKDDQHGDEEQLATPKFKEYALDLIDRIFTTS